MIDGIITHLTACIQMMMASNQKSRFFGLGKNRNNLITNINGNVADKLFGLNGTVCNANQPVNRRIGFYGINDLLNPGDLLVSSVFTAKMQKDNISLLIRIV